MKRIKIRYIIIIIVTILIGIKVKDFLINEQVFRQYIEEEYGLITKEFKIIRKGSHTNEVVKDVNGWIYRPWVRSYEIRTPIREKSFEVWVNNTTHTIFGDNFYDRIDSDKTFRHLYSEWVKKQIGVKDENAEFDFTRLYAPPYIEFDKIISMSDDFNEIFENIHNLYVMEGRVSKKRFKRIK